MNIGYWQFAVATHASPLDRRTALFDHPGMADFSLIIVAGGSGSRMQADRKKAFIELADLPLVVHTAATTAVRPCTEVSESLYGPRASERGALHRSVPSAASTIVIVTSGRIPDENSTDSPSAALGHAGNVHRTDPVAMSSAGLSVRVRIGSWDMRHLFVLPLS